MLIRSLAAALAASAALCTAAPAQETQPAAETRPALTDARTYVTPVNDRDYFPAVMKLIAEAEETLRVCLYQVTFYEEYPDSNSNQLVDALADAARRGVEVTAVIDQTSWRGAQEDANLAVAKMLAEAGVAVYFDHPEIQSHQKLFIADREAVIVASINWSHFSLTQNREVAMLVWSPEVAREYSHYFARVLADATYFDYEAAVEPAEDGSLYDRREELGFESWPVEDVELLNNRHFYYKLVPELRAATESIDVVQSYAYFYGDTPRQAEELEWRPAGKPSETDLLAQELIDAADRGVRVRVVLDYTMDGDFVKDWDPKTRTFAMRLYEGNPNIEIFRDDPSEQIHAKMLVIDGDQVVVGSSNWSFPALEMNNETNVLVESEAVVEEAYEPWVTDIIERAQRWYPYD